MAKIKAYTDYSERSNTHYYTVFDIVDKLPKIDDIVYGDDDDSLTHYNGVRERVISISAVSLDSEQGNDEVYDYDYYEVHTRFEEYSEEKGVYEITDEDYSVYYYAVKHK